MTQQRWELDMATATEVMDAEHAASLRRRYLVRFEEDMLAPTWACSPRRNGALLFDLNDFRRDLPGPFEYDVKRMAASISDRDSTVARQKKEQRCDHVYVSPALGGNCRCQPPRRRQHALLAKSGQRISGCYASPAMLNSLSPQPAHSRRSGRSPFGLAVTGRHSRWLRRPGDIR
jgi:hypothetical protein